MILMIRCILYPRCKLFVTSGGKEQAAGIMKEKVKEICTLIPAFEKEIDWRRGQSLEGKDYCKYVFKNGSYFDNIAARESSRGKRRHGGLIEECVGVDGDILSTVIIPTMNISRMCMDGSTQPEETLNKSQIYVTTAGFKNTYPYVKHTIIGAYNGDIIWKNSVNPKNWGVALNNAANSEWITLTLCQAA